MSQRLNRGGTIEPAQPLRQNVPLDLKRSCPRKILFVKDDSMNALVIEQSAVERRNSLAQVFGESLARLQMNHEHKLFACHRTLRPDVVSGEDAKFLDRQALEDRFNIFGIDVLAFLGDDHIFLATEELEMAGGIEASEVAGL